MPASRLNHRLIVATVCLSAALIGAFVLAAYSFVSSHRASCRSRDTSLTVMTKLLVAAQQQTDSDPTVPAEKKQQSDQFVSNALDLISKARC